MSAVIITGACYFDLFYILTIGPSIETKKLTWLLFFGAPVIFIIFYIKSRHDKNSWKQEGDFAMKINKPMPTNISALKEKIKLYDFLFEDCQTIDEIILVYMNHNAQDKWFNAVEIELLRYYLQICSNFKKETWRKADLIDRIANSYVHENLSGEDIFASYVINDKPQNSKYKNEPIEKRDESETYIYKRLHKMRQISREKKYYNSEAVVFIKQGKYMETFSDHYNGNVPFQGYRPTYDSMNDDQLRTYFTWRTKIRNGELAKTSPSYVFVYIYELINNIGIKDTKEVIEKLIWLLKNHQKVGERIKEYLIKWIKDYYVCNEFSVTFKEIVIHYNIEEHYPTIITNEVANKYCFNALGKFSKYKIEDSKFLTKENKKTFIRCFDKVISNLTPLLSLYGTDIDELIMGECVEPVRWRPFGDAVYKETAGDDKKVVISKDEIYISEENQWMVYKTSQYSYAAALVMEYIIKKIESNLRSMTKYRYKLSPSISKLLEHLQGNSSISKKIVCAIADTSFDQIIDEATKLAYLSHLSGQDDTELLSISKGLSSMVEIEPYLTFIKMRKIDDSKNESDITKKFIKQAGILENLTDDYETAVPFESPEPLYENMSNEQLRSYVTWRTKVRRGEYPTISDAYIYLYIFELINLDGKNDTDKTIDILALLLKNCANKGAGLERLLTSCIKDCYLCGSSTRTFYEILQCNKIEYYYPNVFIEYSKDLLWEGLLRISNYDISKSKFYNEQTSLVIKECFKYVFEDVQQYFTNQSINLKQIIAGKGSYKHRWRPFRNTPCDRYPNSSKRVVICSNEAYSYQYNEWICEMMPEKDNTGSILIGYMLKRMELNIRTILKFKYKLTADITSISKRLTDQQICKAVEKPDFNQTIDAAVIRFFKEKYPRAFSKPDLLFENPIEVKIDVSKLSKIRNDADIIRDKLIIDDEPKEALPTLTMTGKTTKIKPDHYDNPIEEFCAGLTEFQKEALLLILNESPCMPGIMKLARNSNSMPEILLEGINESFLELTGDNVIETAGNNPYIYEDYLDEIKMYLEETYNGKKGS